MRRAFFLLALATGLIVGCGSDFEIIEQPLQGTIGGQTWTFVEGDTSDFLSDDESFFSSLHSEAFETCGFGGPSGSNSLLLRLPTEPGEWELSLQRNMTFVVDDGSGPENLIGTEGVLRIDSVTDTLVTGGIHTSFDGDNEVNGTFAVTICPPT